MATTSPTTAKPGDRFERLLSTRGRLSRPAGGGGPARGDAKPMYEFAGGRPDPASFPYAELVAATAEMMETEGAEALTYGEAQGYPGLRAWVGDLYRWLEGLEIDPANILITNGSGQGLALVLSALVDVGDAVICEAPTFLGTLGAMRRHGAEIHGVPVDDEGIVTSSVRERLEALRREGRACKLIYTMPTFHNPAGVTATLARRRELIDLAREYDTLLLEDDAYGALRFAGEQVPSLYALDGGERVVRSGTISKVLGAGLRLGWLIAPRELIPIFQGFNFGGGVNPFVSRVATYYMRENMVEHIETLRDVYRDKRDAMLRGLREGLDGVDVAISQPEGGFFLWLTLPENVDPGRVAELAAKAHVHYLPGPAFYPGGEGKEFIRLAYSYESPERCYEGAKALGAAIRQACE